MNNTIETHTAYYMYRFVSFYLVRLAERRRVTKYLLMITTVQNNHNINQKRFRNKQITIVQ